MIKLKGKLNWNEEKGYYMTVNTEHYSQNVYIEEDLNENLMDNIKIKVTALK